MATPAHGTPAQPPEGWIAARSSIPAEARAVCRRGLHVLLRVTPFWYVLIGPDDNTDLPWVAPFLPAEHDWTATFETFVQTLVTHFMA
jgi:hypothetical protein